MHLLATTAASLDDQAEPVDLAQPPRAVLALSFSDSDLNALRAAAGEEEDFGFAALRELRHPMSVDLWIEKTASHAEVVLVRLLGGYDWWRYGCDRLSELAKTRGLRLVLLPGECREDDDRLAALSTVDPNERAALLDCFREGGPDNLTRAVARLRRLAGRDVAVEMAQPLPRAGYHGPVPDDLAPRVPVIFYRSMLLAGDVAPVDALAGALTQAGLSPVPIYLASLKDPASLAFLDQAMSALKPAAIVTATAFATGGEPGVETPFARWDAPVFQAVVATTSLEAWESGPRGLAPADLAMHVALPELDGRILAGAISFKAATGTGHRMNRAEPDRIAQVAARIAAQIRLQAAPPWERRIALLLPDYPGAAGRAGYAVGLDVPASVLAILADLRQAGYDVGDLPEDSRALMRMLDQPAPALSPGAYRSAFAAVPDQARQAVLAAWGEPGNDAFAFRHARFGKVTVALAPDRGRSADRRLDYHDPALPPRHELVAFGIWLRERLNIHALLHLGAHGVLEWLPGKTVALTRACFPEIVTGALPVIYPFVVSNPGEAAQAKRRIAAVTIGHLTPPLVGAGLSPAERELEQLVDEYAQADGLDRRRRDRLARLIVERAAASGLARQAGVADDADPDQALLRIDSWLCDLKDFAIKDGLHIFGRDQTGEALRAASAERERKSLLTALSGSRVEPGPSGAPARGRTDVLPTGRNLYTVDPRTMPTPTAYALGKAACEEAMRVYAQEHGEWPRALVIDLWGSASLRTGGEEIAQGLALLGCRPRWDFATGRVTGVEVLPPAALGRPRVDVTFRISGLFRDMFAAQIALIDAAVAAVAARDEEPSENPLVAARLAEGPRPARIFGSAPGTYGSGVEEQLAGGGWEDRAELGRAYLEAGSHSFGGSEGEARHAPGQFGARIREAALLLHTADDPGRDILEGSADVAFVGGFAAAVEALGGAADLVILDTTDTARPRARSLAEAVARTVRARALNPVFIAGQLRHGPRGASEFAETVDRLIGFAETTDAVAPALIEAVYDTYIGDERIRAFLIDQNPAAARAIAERFASARRRSLWRPRRNAVDDELAALIAEARLQEIAA